jgi:hypothetical protein
VPSHAQVWVDNLPYDATLSDAIDCFGKTWFVSLLGALSTAAACVLTPWCGIATCSTVTGVTLFRPPLSAATLLRRRIAEHDALGMQISAFRLGVYIIQA